MLLKIFTDFFEPVDQLLFRSAAFELISNPTKKYCIPCRTVFPYTTSNEIEEFEVHIQEHSIKKEDLSSGLLSCTGSAKCSKLFQNQEALGTQCSKIRKKNAISKVRKHIILQFQKWQKSIFYTTKKFIYIFGS